MRQPGSRHDGIQSSDDIRMPPPLPHLGFMASAWLSAAGGPPWSRMRRGSGTGMGHTLPKYNCANSHSKISYTHILTQSLTVVVSPRPPAPLYNKTVLYRDFLNDIALHCQLEWKEFITQDLGPWRGPRLMSLWPWWKVESLGTIKDLIDENHLGIKSGLGESPIWGLHSLWYGPDPRGWGEGTWGREASTGTRDFLVLDSSQLESISFYRWGTDTKQGPQWISIKSEVCYILPNSINSWMFCAHIPKHSCSCFSCSGMTGDLYFHLYSTHSPLRSLRDFSEAHSW